MTSHLEVVSELFSDDDDKPEKDNEFEEEFDLSSSDDESEKDCQVDFTAPEIEVEQDNFVQSEDLDDNFSWIIIWILKYQEKHRLPNVAIDSLFKLFYYVLINLPNQTSFVTFSTSLYMARKKLGMCVHLIKYAACKECCKLYQISDVSSNDPNITPKFTKCIFQDFPNHSKSYGRKPCETPLYKNICTKNGVIKRPVLIFPTISLRNQLNILFNQKGFEESCKKWINRHSDPEILTDIYDGRMWKSFKDEDGSLFFRTDLADAHLGLMLSMDWFQPFDNSQYSTGAIYAIICNLPRNERFKPSNIITLALIPGPNEPKLHQLNHYLVPLVDQLIELWQGVELPKTFEHPNGKKIKCAIFCCSCDIPATRKLCGHILARIACYRYIKQADYDDRNQPNFSGLSDMDTWFIERDVKEVRKNAIGWKNCKTQEQRQKHVSETFVRWSEIYRLPYFDPVRFLVVDPMHCLFLGIAKWIVTRLWIEEGKLTLQDLTLMQKRADKIQVSADVGRTPKKISIGEGFSGYSADQWKTFMMIYATTITWDLLEEPD